MSTDFRQLSIFLSSHSPFYRLSETNCNFFLIGQNNLFVSSLSHLLANQNIDRSTRCRVYTIEQEHLEYTINIVIPILIILSKEGQLYYATLVGWLSGVLGLWTLSQDRSILVMGALLHTVLVTGKIVIFSEDNSDGKTWRPL